MTTSIALAQQAVTVIQERAANFKPRVAIILGSGVAELAQAIAQPIIIPYEELPGFPKSTVAGHKNQLYLGTLQDVPVVCLQGRVHSYEGISMKHIRAFIYTLRLLGCEILLATNAAGSLHSEIVPGNLMLVSDHINFQFSNPLVGETDQTFGSQFVALENAYDMHLRQQLLRCAHDLKMELPQGVYVGVLGPSFETPAEIQAFRILGADVVGMSTVPEVIVARYCGMRVAAISIITNLAAGMSEEKPSHEQTLRVAGQAAGNLRRLLMEFIKNREF
ncbi:MAG: purine-nucleoside phosphorylase [Gammaproteobacteria bacterium]